MLDTATRALLSTEVLSEVDALTSQIDALYAERQLALHALHPENINDLSPEDAQLATQRAALDESVIAIDRLIRPLNLRRWELVRPAVEARREADEQARLAQESQQ